MRYVYGIRIEEPSGMYLHNTIFKAKNSAVEEMERLQYAFPNNTYTLITFFFDNY